MSVTTQISCAENLKSINILKLLVQSSIGPNGKLKLLCNGCGGHVQLTSSSIRILTSIKITKPLLKIIAQAAINHLKCHNNAGLYFMSLVCEMLGTSLKLSVPQCRLVQLNRVLGQAASTHLGECGWKINVGFDDLHLLLTLSNSILGSKPACQLSETDQRHLAILLMRSFLNGAPAANEGTSICPSLHYIFQHNSSPQNSKIYSGVFIEVSSSNFRLPNQFGSLGGSYKCALFHISLSGDADTNLVNDEANIFLMGDGIGVVGACSSRILDLCTELLTEEVDLVACQKVIHPSAKIFLENHGILVLDRLGIVQFDAMLELTGCCAIESFMAKVDPSNFGLVDALSVIEIGEKKYYHVQSGHSLVSTLLICNHLEESLEELKIVCRQTEDTLRNLLRSPFVYPGGGCLETHLAAYIRHWGHKNKDSLLKILQNKGDIFLAVENFASNLEHIAVILPKHSAYMQTDENSHHLWMLEPKTLVNDNGPVTSRCCCGLMKKSELQKNNSRWRVLTEESLPQSVNFLEDPWNEDFILSDQSKSLIIVDGFVSKFEAFKAALETSVALLSVDSIVKK